MGKHHEEKIEIMRKYLMYISTGFAYHIKDIPSKKIDNAIKKFAFSVDKTSIIGFYVLDFMIQQLWVTGRMDIFLLTIWYII